MNFVNTHLVGNGTFPIEDEYPVDPDAIVPVPAWTMPNWPEVRQMTAGYFSQVLNIDAMMGDILGALEDLGLRESTMSLFVSDNGAPFPGNKKTMFDRGIGTPWIAHWPGTLPAGRTSSALVSTIDLAPTILDGAGLAPMEVMDGESVLPLLAGLTEEGRDEVFAAVDWHVKSVATRGARTVRYKLIRNFGDDPVGLGQLSSLDWAHAVCELPNHPWKQAPIPIGLYDLQEDPDEQANLADDPNYADVLEEMAWRMRAHMEEVGDPNLPSL